MLVRGLGYEHLCQGLGSRWGLALIGRLKESYKREVGPQDASAPEGGRHSHFGRAPSSRAPVSASRGPAALPALMSALAIIDTSWKVLQGLLVC